VVLHQGGFFLENISQAKGEGVEFWTGIICRKRTTKDGEKLISPFLERGATGRRIKSSTTGDDLKMKVRT